MSIDDPNRTKVDYSRMPLDYLIDNLDDYIARVPLTWRWLIRSNDDGKGFYCHLMETSCVAVAGQGMVGGEHIQIWADTPQEAFKQALEQCLRICGLHQESHHAQG